MAERIPTHLLNSDRQVVPAIKIFRLKNSEKMEVDQAAHLPTTPLPTDAPHRHNYYEIVYIEKGEGYHEIDFQTYPIQGAGLHFLLPGQVHLLRFHGSCQGYIMAFSEDFFSFYNPESSGLATYPFFRPQQRQPVLTLGQGDQPYFHNLVGNMAADHLTPDTDHRIMGKYLGILLQKSAQLIHIADSERISTFSHPDLIANFQQLVETHHREHHTVQYYANKLDISPDYLSRSIKKFLGHSAGEYILTKLLLEAKRLLVFTTMSSKQIAYSLFIEDPSYFGRIFKRKTGLTPNEYRASVRKSAIS